jgi:hypothetical protein
MIVKMWNEVYIIIRDVGSDKISDCVEKIQFVLELWVDE